MIELQQGIRQFLVTFEWLVLFYLVIVNTFYFCLLISAAVEMRRHLRTTRGEDLRRLLSSPLAPRITMLAPAYNEAVTISESLTALMVLEYPNLEVIVINDGSKDTTLAVLQEHFELYPIYTIYRRQVESKEIRALYRSRLHPNLTVVDKVNGGKADALNAGLNVASGELVCAMDADTLINRDALLHMVRPFLVSDKVIAVGGTIRVVNGCEVVNGTVVKRRASRQALAGFQTVEYLRAFLFGRLGWNLMGGNLIVSGAFGLFRLQTMVSAGGYMLDTVGEDMELVMRLRRTALEQGKPHRVEFVPDPIAWTEVPDSLRVLSRQRDRWHRGLADVLWRHRQILFRRRYGTMGMVAFPYFVFVELIAPVVEALGLILLPLTLLMGGLNWEFALLFFLAAYGYGLILTVATLVLEEASNSSYGTLRDRLWLVLWTLVENLGYRQLTVVWRLQGLWKYLKGRRDWGTMERRGFSRTDASKQEPRN